MACAQPSHRSRPSRWPSSRAIHRRARWPTSRRGRSRSARRPASARAAGPNAPHTSRRRVRRDAARRPVRVGPDGGCEGGTDGGTRPCRHAGLGDRHDQRRPCSGGLACRGGTRPAPTASWPARAATGSCGSIPRTTCLTSRGGNRPPRCRRSVPAGPSAWKVVWREHGPEWSAPIHVAADHDGGWFAAGSCACPSRRAAGDEMEYGGSPRRRAG
jgi:hypothetical protein